MANKQAERPADAPSKQEGHERFNLATMSGVFPGTRTAVYQRVQVEAASARFWLQLLWHDEPLRVVAYRLTGAKVQREIEPLLTVTLDGRSVLDSLVQALRAKGCTMRACGNCAFWQPFAGLTADQLPVGGCAWRRPAESDPLPAVELPEMLRSQSCLASACRNWQLTAATLAAPSSVPTTKGAPPVAMRRAAEDAEIRHPVVRRLWRRWHRWLAGRSKGATVDQTHSVTWVAGLVERSGVGAGTEPCLTCQGRIANLGALTVATEDDDKQTFSIWRCRDCYALYLNDWIDRWERLDSLETEESYYRIAPEEASYLLTLIHTHQGGEHPNRRHERTTVRQTILNFLNGRTPLSHQIRQGR